ALLADGKVIDLPGLGSELMAAGQRWRLGRADWAAGTEATGDPDGNELASRAILSVEGQPLASFRFTETPRREAAACIAAMQDAGRPVYLLSGDRPERVLALADSLGLPA